MSVISKGAAQIFDVFKREGAKAFLVGGTVRNHLWGLPIADRDFAVSCPPKETLHICEKHKLKTIPTGIDHGTITILANGESFEATSFRKDVQTDGRHAITEFGGTIEEDALRRDFTINAIYLDAKARIIDPLGGAKDIQDRRLKFVGDAQTRIREDYLRILRFFRFYAQYDLSADQDAIEAIAVNIDGLEQISAERIGVEMRKLLSGERFAEALVLAEKTNPDLVENLNIFAAENWKPFEKRHGIEADWRQRCAAICAEVPSEEWRLSKAESTHIQAIRKALHDSHPPAVMGHIYGAEIARQAIELRAFSGAKLPFHYRSQIKEGAAQIFPLSGQDILALGLEGKAVGDLLKQLKDEWYYNNFALDKDALLALAIEKLKPSES